MKSPFKVLFSFLIFALPSSASAAWGDLYCDIYGNGEAALKAAVDLYNEPVEDDRACLKAIRFFAPMTITLNDSLIISQSPPTGSTYGGGFRRCNGSESDGASCPIAGNNTAVILDFSGYTANGGKCPIRVAKGVKAGFANFKMTVKDKNYAICEEDTGKAIPVDDLNNPYAWIHNVKVEGSDTPNSEKPTCSIDVTYPSGGGYDVSWTTTNATTVFASCGDFLGGGPLFGFWDTKSGNKHVNSSSPTSCGLYASGPGGTCTDSVKVTPPKPATPPTCTLTKTAVPTGGYDLAWTTTNATSATLSDGSMTLSSALNSSSPVHVDPTVTTTYTLSASGSGGSCQDVEVVTVTPPTPTAPTCDLNSVANPNGGFDLTWTTTNTMTADLRAEGAVMPLSTDLNSAAPVNVNPAQTTVYRLTATGSGGTCQDVVVVTVTPQPTTVPTCDLTAVVNGGGFDLAWTSANGATASLSDGMSTLSTDLNSPAPLSVTPVSTTSYTLTVTGTGGTCSDTIVLTPNTPVPTAPTCDLQAAVSGDGFDLSWTSTNGATAALSDNLTTLSTELNSSAPLHVTPVSKTTYTLTVTSSGGSCSKSVTLEGDSVGPPPPPPPPPPPVGCVDTDADGLCDSFEGVLGTDPNDQDTDNDGTNDPMDCAPLDPARATGTSCAGVDTDFDDDGAPNVTDNCPAAPNAGQEDVDSDGIGDVCDPTPSETPKGGPDTDGDGIPDAIETNTFETDPNKSDSDGDGLNDGDEVQSPFFPACGPLDPDCDDDGVCDGPGTVRDAADNVICAPTTEGKGDNCRLVSNGPNTAGITAEDIQKDSDGDGTGDACQDDQDGDEIQDDLDNCVFIPNKRQEDADANGIGDACDLGFAFSTVAASGGCGCRMEGTSSHDGATSLVGLGLSLALLGFMRRRAL